MQTSQQSLLQIFKNNALEAITFLICEFCFMNSVVFKKNRNIKIQQCHLWKQQNKCFILYSGRKNSHLFLRERRNKKPYFCNWIWILWNNSKNRRKNYNEKIVDISPKNAWVQRLKFRILPSYHTFQCAFFHLSLQTNSAHK